MVRIIIASIASLLFVTSTLAQSEVFIQKRLFKSEPKSSFVVSVERSDVKEKDIEDIWKDYVKNFDSKPDFDKDQNLSISEDVNLPELSSGGLHIFMRKNTLPEDQMEFAIWIKSANDGFIGGDHPKVAFAKQWVLEYALNVKRYQITERLEEKVDDLEDLQDDREDLVDDIADSKKEIEKLRDDIEKEEKKIVEAENELPELESTLQEVQKRVNILKAQLKEVEARKAQRDG